MIIKIFHLVCYNHVNYFKKQHSKEYGNNARLKSKLQTKIFKYSNTTIFVRLRCFVYIFRLVGKQKPRGYGSPWKSCARFNIIGCYSRPNVLAFHSFIILRGDFRLVLMGIHCIIAGIFGRKSTK